jgi:hypothetical protein
LQSWIQNSRAMQASKVFIKISHIKQSFKCLAHGDHG